MDSCLWPPPPPLNSTTCFHEFTAGIYAAVVVFRNHAIFWSKVYSVWFERFLHIVSCAIVEEVDYSDISFGDFSFLEEVIWGSTLTRSPYSPSPRPLWWLFISGGYMGQHIDSPPLCAITIWRLFILGGYMERAASMIHHHHSPIQLLHNQYHHHRHATHHPFNSKMFLVFKVVTTILPVIIISSLLRYSRIMIRICYKYARIMTRIWYEYYNGVLIALCLSHF